MISAKNESERRDTVERNLRGRERETTLNWKQWGANESHTSSRNTLINTKVT